MWRNISSYIGGVHMFGPMWIVIHDGGVTIAWKQIVRADWRV